MIGGPLITASDDVFDSEIDVPWWGDDGYDGSLIDPGAGETA